GAPFAIHDRDGDGIPELVAVDHTGPGVLGGTTRVLSGAAVMATPVGSQVPASAVLATIPGTVDGFALPDDQPGQGDPLLAERRGGIVTVQAEADRVLVRLWHDGRTTTYS